MIDIMRSFKVFNTKLSQIRIFEIQFQSRILAQALNCFKCAWFFIKPLDLTLMEIHFIQICRFRSWEF